MARIVRYIFSLFKPLSDEETVFTILQDYPERCLVILTTTGERLVYIEETLFRLILTPNDEHLWVSFPDDTLR